MLTNCMDCSIITISLRVIIITQNRATVVMLSCFFIFMIDKYRNREDNILKFYKIKGGV